MILKTPKEPIITQSQNKILQTTLENHKIQIDQILQNKLATKQEINALILN